jgi:hypothetical protein
MRNVWFGALCVLVLVGMAQAQVEKSDLEAYIEQIRASGMTETARMQIHSVASVYAGGTILEYRQDEASGQYWPSYMSATCPKPDADPPEVEQWKQLRVSEADVLVDRLKPFADADQSGFVTTGEAGDFRYLIEFGHLVAQVVRDEGGTLQQVARASGMGPADAKARIAAYNALSSRIVQAGVAELPEAILGD